MDVHNSEGNSLRNTLLFAEPVERQQLLESCITEQLARVLRTPVSKLDIAQPLINMGLDSLMAVELSNRLKSERGVDVPTMKILQGLSISQLVELVLEQLALTRIIPSVPLSAELSEEMEEITL